MREHGEFVSAYIEALLWAESGDDDSPLGKDAMPEELSADAMADIERDCALFLAEPTIAELVDKHGETKCGHDFWLTRRHHGAGFWDGDYPKDAEDALMTQCAKFHDPDPYRGDDGMIYFLS